MTMWGVSAPARAARRKLVWPASAIMPVWASTMARAAGALQRLRRFLLSGRRLRWRVVRALRRLPWRRRTTYLDDRVAEYRAYWEEASQALHATFEPVCTGVWEIRRGARRTRVANYRVQIDDPVILRLAANKAYCCEVARRLGIPVAPHWLFRLGEVDTAWRFMARRGGLFVVKPAGASAGLGVTMQVRTRRELESAAALASLYSDELMVETMIAAESCRLLYLDGELIHAVRRRGLHIVGDGRSSVRDLLARGGYPRLHSDQPTLCTLETQGLSLDSRLAAGKEVLARYLPAAQQLTEELRTVYNESITGRVSQRLARSLACLVREVGSRLAGVDVLTNDPTVPLAESGGVFLELNTTPALHHHYVDSQEPPVALRVLRYLLEENRP